MMEDLELFVDKDGDKWIFSKSQQVGMARLTKDGEFITTGITREKFNDIFAKKIATVEEACSKCGTIVRHKCPYPYASQTPGTLLCSRCM